MVDIYDPAFWDDEKRRMWDRLGPIYARLITAGAMSGESALPEALRLLIDWDVFNQAAIDYLRRVRLEWVDGITDTTRDGVVKTITDWIEAGEDMPTLEARLERYFTNDRARRIAVTEVTRTYADGNQLAWHSSGVVSAKVWQTAQDERVCPLCGPLHNTVVALDDVYVQTPRDLAGPNASQQELDRAAGLLRHNGTFVGGPPRHPNCRCWLKPVVSLEMSEQARQERLRQAFGSTAIDSIKVRLSP